MGETVDILLGRNERGGWSVVKNVYSGEGLLSLRIFHGKSLMIIYLKFLIEDLK